MPGSYIPATDAAFDAWAANFSTLLTANPTAYGEDAPSALVVQNAYDAWSAAYVLATDPSTRTPTTVADKDAERVALDATARPVALRINARTSVSNLQRTALGITVRKLTRTPVAAPTTAPVLTLRSQIAGVARLQIRDESTPTTKAKPLGVIGVDLHVFVGDTPPVSFAEYPLVKTTGKTPNTLPFSGAQSGMTANVVARWTTRSGPGGTAQKGPWSVPEVFVIM